MVPLLAAISTIDSLASGAASIWKEFSSKAGTGQAAASGSGETGSFASVLSAAQARGGSHAMSSPAQGAGLHSGGAARSLAAASGALTASATAPLLDRLA